MNMRDSRASVLNLAAAKVSELIISFEPSPVETNAGKVIWATVGINYVLGDLSPTIHVKVPLMWDDSAPAEMLRTNALRAARQLIDHICVASGTSGTLVPN